jgi:hypothetical protein
MKPTGGSNQDLHQFRTMKFGTLGQLELGGG